MKRKILLTIFSLIFSASLMASNACNSDECDLNCFETGRVSLSCSAGRYISIDRNYAEIELFSPIFQTNSCLSFLDLHGYKFLDDGRWAASLGGGVRKYISEDIIGLNVYYDYLDSKHSFHQIGLGGEWLSNCFDVRINGYLPISEKTHTHRFVFDKLGDGLFATKKRIEFAYSGFDAEIGSSLLNYCDYNVYAAVGPYYFYRSHFEHFWGGLARVEINWRSIVSLQVRASYDHVHNTRVQGTIQLSIPFDFFCSCQCQCTCDNLLNQPVRRNGIILTDTCCDWTWNWDDTN